MSVRARMIVALIGIAALLVLPTLYGIDGLRRIRDIVVELRGRHAAALVTLGRLETHLAELDRVTRSYVITADPEFRTVIVERIARSRTLLARIDDAGYETVATDATLAVDSLASALRRVEASVVAGDDAAAANGFGVVEGRLGRVRRSLDPIAREIDRRSDAEVVRAQRATTRVAWTTLIAALVAVAVAVVVGTRSTNALTSPLRRLGRATARVAAGEFSAPATLPYDRRDEIGDLSRSFRSMTGRLAELDRVRAEFLSMTSHDLKTPISVIHSYAEVLAHGTFGEVTKRQSGVLRTIQDQTRLLTDAVNELVQIGRVEAGGFRIETAAVDARAFFDAIRRAFDGLARQQGIDLVVEVADDVPETVMLDPVRLRNEVLGNLLSNAFKFTPADGRIDVRVARAHDRLHIRISDTGPGIPPDHLPHIFDAYYQASSDTAEKGTGLGLAIARRIVQAHGGTIAASSETGRGTAFRIDLPIGASVETGRAGPGVRAAERVRA